MTASLDMLTDNQVEYLTAVDSLMPNFNAAPLADHHPRIIGLSGYARSGKNTVADILSSLYGYEQRAFADRLKGFVFQINGLVFNQEHGVHRVQEAVGFYGADAAKEKAPEYRRLLQEVGTKSREFFGADVWVNSCFGTMEVGHPYVITDVRFKNEAERIRSVGGAVFRVDRPGVGPINDHVSEIEMDDWPFDATIENDGSLLDLQGSVMIALGDLG